MKNSFLVILMSTLFIFSAHNVEGQYHWEWGKAPTLQATAFGLFEGTAVSVNKFGQLYSAGSNDIDSVTFDSTLYTSATRINGFLIRQDTAGNIKWIRTFPGCIDISGVLTDSVGFVYITGIYQYDTFVVCGDTLLGVDRTEHTFVAKIDSNGSAVWTYDIDSSTFRPRIALDYLGNIVLTGYFQHRLLVLGRDTLYGVNSTIDPFNLFVMKFNNTGSVVWAKQLTNIPDSGTCTLSAVAIDHNNNILVAGYYDARRILIGSYAFSTPGLGVNYTFVGKIKPNGSTSWFRSFSGISFAEAVCVDNNDRVYVGGRYYGNSLSIDTVSLGTTVREDIFLCSLDSTGAALWARQFGGIYDDMIWDLQYDNNANRIWACGELMATAAFDTFTLVGTPFDGAVVFQCDTSGHVTFGTTLPFGGDDFDGIAIDAVSNVYLCSDYLFQTSTSHYLVGDDTLCRPPVNGENFFVAKLAGPWYRPPIITNGISTNPQEQFNCTVAPCPADNYINIEIESASSLGNYALSITDLNGRVIQAQSVVGNSIRIETDSFDNGIYFITVRGNGTIPQTEKVVIMH